MKFLHVRFRISHNFPGLKTKRCIQEGKFSVCNAEVILKATEIQCPRSHLRIQRIPVTLMNTVYAQAETLSKHWASLGALLRCCRVIGNSNHYFLLSVRAPEVQMQRTKLKALRHVGCALRNFSLSFTCCEIFNSKSYLLMDIDLHQTCLHGSNKKLIIRLSSCQEFKRWLQYGCLREQKFCLSRD